MAMLVKIRDVNGGVKVWSMDPEVKDTWLNALRSGQYVQGQERLATSDGKFCCLGVLCDVMLVESDEAYWQKPHEFSAGYELVVDEEIFDDVDDLNDYYESLAEYSDWNRNLMRNVRGNDVLVTADTHIPRHLMTEWGMGDQAVSHLIEMNDEGNSFVEIADWIEKNL